MAVKTLILMGLLACLTVRQQAVWMDDVSLWRQAVRVAPQSPRAAINLALAYRKAGDREAAVMWLIRADALVEGHPREASYRRVIWAHVGALQMAGVPVCDSLLLSRYC